MRVQASAGRDRKKDLRTYCASVKLIASNDEEAAALAVLVDQLQRPRGVEYLIDAARKRKAVSP